MPQPEKIQRLLETIRDETHILLSGLNHTPESTFTRLTTIINTAQEIGEIFYAVRQNAGDGKVPSRSPVDDAANTATAHGERDMQRTQYPEVPSPVGSDEEKFASPGENLGEGQT